MRKLNTGWQNATEPLPATSEGYRKPRGTASSAASPLGTLRGQ
jgi:hypothetical protein